jgi:hypothetical protein
MLAYEASPESVAILTGQEPVPYYDPAGLALSEPDYPYPDERPAMPAYDEEAQRLGYLARDISRNNGTFIGGLPGRIDPVSGALVRRRQGWRPEGYDHLQAEAERQAERAAAGYYTELSAQDDLSDDDMVSALSATAASSGISLADLIDARDELAKEREPLDNRNRAVRVRATADIIRMTGYDGGRESELLSLTAEAEEQRLMLPLAMRRALGQGTDEARDGQEDSRRQASAALDDMARRARNVPGGHVVTREMDRMFGTEHPTGEAITSSTRAHSGQTAAAASEIDRLADLFNKSMTKEVPHSGNRVTKAKSASQRQREQARATTRPGNPISR